MKRLFWLAVGASAGAVVVRRITRAAGSVSPEGIAGAVSSLGDGFRVFADEVRAGMHEREAELRDDLGLNDAAEAAGNHFAEGRVAEGTVHPSRPGAGQGDTY